MQRQGAIGGEGRTAGVYCSGSTAWGLLLGVVGLGEAVGGGKTPAGPGQLVGINVGEFLAGGLGFVTFVGLVRLRALHAPQIPRPSPPDTGLSGTAPGNALD